MCIVWLMLLLLLLALVDLWVELCGSSVGWLLLSNTRVVRMVRARMSLLSSFFNSCSLIHSLSIYLSFVLFSVVIFLLSRLNAIDFHRKICSLIPSHAVPLCVCGKWMNKIWKEQSRVCQNLLHAESLNGKRTFLYTNEETS